MTFHAYSEWRRVQRPRPTVLGPPQTFSLRVPSRPSRWMFPGGSGGPALPLHPSCRERPFPAFSHASRGFTAAEMLTVILILSLLITLLVPSVRLVQRRMERNRAAADANALVQAVMHYQQVYGEWPIPAGSSANGSGFYVFGINSILTTAACLRTTYDLSPVLRRLNPDSPDNPRQLSFLTLPTNTFDKGEFVDPWRARYVLVMSAQNGMFDFAGIAFSNLSAFAISSGPPMANQSSPSNWVFSAGVRP